MVGAGEAADIGRSILVGVALDQLRVRTRLLFAALGLVALAALIGAFLFDDALRVLAVVVFVVALAGLAIAFVLRLVAGRLLQAIAPPTDVTEHRAAIQDAIDQLALPTGPVSGLKFAWGLRDGIDDEVANASEVISTLRDRLSL